MGAKRKKKKKAPEGQHYEKTINQNTMKYGE
jgi:hypothetical protein